MVWKGDNYEECGGMKRGCLCKGEAAGRSDQGANLHKGPRLISDRSALMQTAINPNLETYTQINHLTPCPTLIRPQNSFTRYLANLFSDQLTHNDMYTHCYLICISNSIIEILVKFYLASLRKLSTEYTKIT